MTPVAPVAPLIAAKRTTVSGSGVVAVYDAKTRARRGKRCCGGAQRSRSGSGTPARESIMILAAMAYTGEQLAPDPEGLAPTKTR